MSEKKKLGASQPRGKRATILKRFTLKSVIEAIIVGILVGFLVHIIDPLIVTYVGKLGPYWADFEYVSNRHEAYELAAEIYERAAEGKDNEIINVRATNSNPQQPNLVNRIIKVLRSSKLRATRVVHISTDPEWVHVSSLLDSLGTRQQFRVIMLLSSTVLPSCVVSDDEMIVGFNDTDLTLSHGFYLKRPQDLIDDFRELYRQVISNYRLAVIVKNYDDTIQPDQVKSVVEKKKSEANAKLEAYRNLLTIR